MIRIIYTSLLLITLQAGAQEGIQAQAEGGKPYISHTVATGETLSGIARSYKLTTDEVVSFNKLSAEKGLQKGQKIRIPLKAGNVSQTECSNCQKIYYKVQPREGLYRIGLNFGNVSAATLQKLNHLPGESVDIGQNLLVGYLDAAGAKPTIETVTNTVDKEAAKPKEEVVKNGTKTTETTERKQPPVVVEKAPPVKEEPKTTPVVRETQPVVAVVQNSSNASGTGLFTPNYTGKTGTSKTGVAAVFMSTSGWDDAKYYVLMNNAEPGTIVKVSSAAGGKTIYAKVLGELPSIKQNENILLRISNAAAAALGGGEETMNVTVSY